MKIEFFVQGEAKPAGSKNGFALKKGGAYTGRVVITDASGAPGKAWRESVKIEARKAYRAAPLEGVPIAVWAIFYRARPKSHFRTGKNAGVLKANAPKFPLPMPDLTKTFRAVEDACTGIIWKDDALVVAQQVQKKYCDADHPQPGVLLRVENWENE